MTAAAKVSLLQKGVTVMGTECSNLDARLSQHQDAAHTLIYLNAPPLRLSASSAIAPAIATNGNEEPQS